MNKRIPQSFIDEIISRADIVELIGRRVALKRSGANYKGLCPFHDEKTPSFTVSPSKGFYHCFGCGAHGTAIGFLIDHDSMSFPEAVEALAEMLGLPLPAVEDDSSRSGTRELLDLLREADQIYRAALRESQSAIDYLKQRGIDGTTAGKFGIGYAPDAWDTVHKALGTDAEHVAKLLQAGLLRKNDQGRHYDYFRNRIMFPIRNARGQVIGFGGRVIDHGEPKYLNSPETPVFLKGQSLYGIYEAREFKGRPSQLIVVEGYLDVASLAQHGIGPALATLGTATTSEHIRRLTRMAERIVFCFDGDAAGRKAAWRALETALPFGGGNIELKFLLLPEGEDPDSFVRERGPEAFNRLVEESESLSQFLIRELKSRNDLATADGRARLLATARPLLAELPGGVYKELLVEELADAVGMKAERIANALGPAPAPSARPRPWPGPVTAARQPSRVQQAITLLLHYPGIASSVPAVDGLEAVTQPGIGLLREVLEIARGRPDVTTAHLVERFREHPEGRYFERLVAREPIDDETAAGRVLHDCLRRIVEDERRRKTVEAIKNRAGGADK